MEITDLRKDFIETFKQELSLYQTDTLVQIWQTHDTDTWVEEAFEAIRQILTGRLETLPSQDDRDAAKNPPLTEEGVAITVQYYLRDFQKKEQTAL